MTYRRLFPGAELAALVGVAIACRAAPGTPAARTAIDRDLLDVTIPQLHRLYADRKYTVTQVVQWHLDRIDRYNGVYGAIETVFRNEALAEAARQDAEAAQSGAAHGPLWGVPIVIKANTSIRGQITTAGWEGFTRKGHELVAPRDATIVASLNAAGAIIVGHANMPDLAASDTNRSSSFGRTGNAYDVRFSPGGSSGGIVTAVAANMCWATAPTPATRFACRPPRARSSACSRRAAWSALPASRRSTGCSTTRGRSHARPPTPRSPCR
jgi:hypothetical protein